MQRRSGRIGVSVHTFRVDVDQPHVHRRQRVFQGGGVVEVGITVLGRGEPFLLGAPIDIGLGRPDVLAAKTEAENLQAGGLQSHVAGENDQIGP